MHESKYAYVRCGVYGCDDSNNTMVGGDVDCKLMIVAREPKGFGCRMGLRRYGRGGM